MVVQHTNSTFASSNAKADSSAYKRAIFCLTHGTKNKRTAPIMKQSFQLTNFSPFCTMTAWTRRKCIRIIIKSDYFSTFYAFVATFTRFFSSCVHKIKFKRLKTCSIFLDIETLLATFFSWTNFNFFSYSCSWSSCSFSFGDKLSCTSISNSSRCFTHFIKTLINNYIITYTTRRVTNAFRI